MNETLEALKVFLLSERFMGVLQALIIIFIGVPLGKFLSKSVEKAVIRYSNPQWGLVAKRSVYYAIITMSAVMALRELGFKLNVLLGAAGVLTVGVGFAAQTSLSNLISGLFLMGEQPFVVGDVIKIGSTTGEVLSIDLLSAKIRTFDNLYVRIPNQELIQNEVTNLTKFPIRRVDVKVGVAYKEDISKVREVLTAVATKNPLCLEDPSPLFMFLGFGDSALDLQFSVWAKKENFLELKTAIHQEIKEAFDAEGIEIPFPHLSVYTGEVTAPFPVRMADKEKL